MYTFFSMQKSPLYAAGTESSDRTSLTAEPPFLSGQMVCRDPIDNEGGGNGVLLSTLEYPIIVNDF